MNALGRISDSGEAAADARAVMVDDGAVQAGRLLHANEVALLLGVPTDYVYALARRGALPYVRLGDRYVRFRLPAIMAWIADRELAALGGQR